LGCSLRLMAPRREGGSLCARAQSLAPDAARTRNILSNNLLLNIYFALNGEATKAASVGRIICTRILPFSTPTCCRRDAGLDNNERSRLFFGGRQIELTQVFAPLATHIDTAWISAIHRCSKRYSLIGAPRSSAAAFAGLSGKPAHCNGATTRPCAILRQRI
jgi:hypothetical protein